MRKWLFIMLVCFGSYAASAQFDSAFRVPYPFRYQLLELIPIKANIYATDTALQCFAHLKQLAEAQNDPKAVLISRLLTYYYLVGLPNYTYATAVKTRDSLIENARKLDFPAIEAAAWLKFADYCYRHNRYAEGFTAHFTAYDIYKSLSTAEFPAKSSTLYYLADSYYRFNDYRHTVFYGRQALDLYDPYGWTPLFCSDLVGMAYLKNGRPDSAAWYFSITRKVAAIQDSYGRAGWTSIAIGNIGLCREAQGADAQAIPLLLQGIAGTSRKDYWNNACVYQIHLARIYLKQGYIAEAAALLEPARSATAQGGDEDARAQLYQLLADYNKLKGNALIALTYRDSSVYWTDSIGRRLNKNMQTQAELAYAEGHHEAEVFRLNSRLRLKRLEVYALLGLLLLVAALAYLIIRGRRQRLLLLEARNERTTASLKRAQERLRQITENIQEKSALIEQIESLPQPTNTTGQQVALVTGLRNSVILTKADWLDFQQVFEQAYPGFVARLEGEQPTLTPAEQRLMVLDHLGLSNKEMAAMLGVSGETIRSTRSRLRKKTGLTDAPEQKAEA